MADQLAKRDDNRVSTMLAMTAGGDTIRVVVGDDGKLVLGSGGSPPSGALTDRSGTVTTGGTAQNAMVANASRKYLLLRNPLEETETLWFDLTATAVAASPSIRLDPGDTFVMEGSFVSTQALSIFAATTGHKWTAKEG